MARRTLVFEDSNLHIKTQPLPEISADEVLIEPVLMGICSTDQELMQGYKDFQGILGHEFVGRVVAGHPDWIGQRVVGEINISCGHCDMCQRQIPTQCRNRRSLGISGDYDGAFADSFRLPIQNLHSVPDNIADEQAVFVEPIAAACEILTQIDVPSSATVIVIGVGKLGMLVAQVLQTTGANVIGVVRHEKQAKLLQQWNITPQTIDEVPLAQADVVVECTGNEIGLITALDLVQPRGTIVLKSTYAQTPQIDLSKIVVSEIQIVGSRCGPFPRALDMLTHNHVEVESLIEAVYPFDEALDAFALANQSGIFKVLLKP